MSKIKQLKNKNMEIKVDKDKVKAVYTNDLISLEILKIPERINTLEEAEEYYNDRIKYKTEIVKDLSEPYFIRVAYTENKKELKSVDPDSLNDGDAYEISETIQDLLRSLKFPVIKSNFPKAPTEATSV